MAEPAPKPAQAPLAAPAVLAARDDGLFAPDALVRAVDRELVVLLGGGRALLMQLAHPGVARGVAEHSDFSADPLGRLQRTLAATYTVVFGTGEQVNRAGAAVRAVHERVRGAGYRAEDPALLLWVHATLVDTELRLHNRLLGPLNPADAERFYQESTRVAEVFGLRRADQPDDLAEFDRYVASMVEQLAAGLTEQSRELARTVLHPQSSLWLRPLLGPAMAGVRELTASLLPPPLRLAYRLPWDRSRQAGFDLAATMTRAVLPRLPAPLRQFPVAAIREPARVA